MNQATLQVGDRVAVYAAVPAAGAYYSGAHGRIKGIVHGSDDSAWKLVVMDGSGDVVQVHDRQCRRLKKRKRRRVWLSHSLLFWETSQTEACVTVFKKKPDHIAELVEFVEVRRK